MDTLRGLAQSLPAPIAGLFGRRTNMAVCDPSYVDVCIARAMLESLKLPTEIVLEILDWACYWPSQDFHIREPHSVKAAFARSSVASLRLSASVLDENIRRMFGQEAVKVKEVEFQFCSGDQGWTSERTQGTFQTSSWLEASIMRPIDSSERPIDPSDGPPSPRPRYLNNYLSSSGEYQRGLQNANRGWTLIQRNTPARYAQGAEDDFAWYLQGNRVAETVHSDYRVVWSTFEDRFHGNEGTGSGEGFLGQLKDGDRILVWARAKWPGWECHVRNLKLTVRYGF